MSDELHLTEPYARRMLEDLQASGLTRVSEGGYELRSDAGSETPLVRKTIETYHRYRLRVTNIIYGPADSRLEDFAEAFRLRQRSKVDPGEG